MPERKPTRTADLDYFYGQSSELFSFYRIPKLLFQDSRFQPLSTDAKTLYGILLDRMSLSARNGWLDKAGRVFIIYTVQEVQDSLGCADKKATKLLRELEEYGLIERKRRGLGKPDLIYVKNFSSESSKPPYLNRDNDDSGTVQNTLQDPAKLRCNKTERNNTEISDTDPIYSDENDWMSKRTQLEDYFSQSLEVDLLILLKPGELSFRTVCPVQECRERSSLRGSRAAALPSDMMLCVISYWVLSGAKWRQIQQLRCCVLPAKMLKRRDIYLNLTQRYRIFLGVKE